MELRQIEYFSAIRKYKNYTKAAQKLHVSQPTLSVAIQKLEEELGVKLLERNNKGIELTREGEIFLEKGEKILNDIENLEKIMEDLKPTAKKHLKVAFPSTVGSWLWKVLLQNLKKQYPNIDLEILDQGTVEIVELLKKEELEVGYGVVGLINDDAIDFKVIRSGELKVIVPNNHPFATMSKVSIDMLEDQEIIMYHKGTTCTEKLLTEYMNKAGVKAKFRYVLEQSTVFDIVAQNCGIAVVLDDSVSIIKDNPHIISKSFVDKIGYETGLLWNKEKYLSKSARNFIDFIENYKENQK